MRFAKWCSDKSDNSSGRYNCWGSSSAEALEDANFSGSCRLRSHVVCLTQNEIHRDALPTKMHINFWHFVKCWETLRTLVMTHNSMVQRSWLVTQCCLVNHQCTDGQDREKLLMFFNLAKTIRNWNAVHAVSPSFIVEGLVKRRIVTPQRGLHP